MTRPIMGYLAGAAFVLSVAGAATAYAQAAPPAPPMPSDHEHGQRIERQVIIKDGDGHVTIQRGGGDEHGMMMGHGGEHRMMMRSDGPKHADHLRTMLQLKPNQEAALTAYLAATAPPHHERIVEMSDHAAPKTTPQRLAEMETRMAEETARSKARIEATRKFYDQLEPSQKKVFDEMPMMMGPMMMHGDGMKMMIKMDGMPPMPPMPPHPPHPPRAPMPPPAPHS
jgi:LTXXQ motif family protein